MRYYKLVLEETEESIGKKASIRLKDYGYDSNVEALNSFMYRNVTLGTTFFVYDDNKTSLTAAFSYNEREYSYEESFASILSLLTENFGMVGTVGKPEEISMLDFDECICEGRRHGFNRSCASIAELACDFVWTYGDYSTDKEWHRIRFDEKTIPLTMPSDSSFISDSTLTKELNRIKDSKEIKVPFGGKLHYVVSSRSLAAGEDITMRLVTALYNAKRLTSRRIEIISNMHPEAYNGSDWIGKIISNAYNGVVIFDLSVRFGHAPSEYLLLSEYLVNLVKKYSNECMFVFNYNADNPGFANYVLEPLSKSVITIPVREGKADRKAAVKYLKSLIDDSELKMYSGQAREYFKKISGDEFTQTDVLEAYSEFPSWCVRKNVLPMYEDAESGEFKLDSFETAESPYDRLQKMIGLNEVKVQVDRMIASFLMDRKRREISGKKNAQSMHMVFYGNPGTAKSTVAELVAGIAKEKKILQSGAFVKVGGNDLNPTSIKTSFIEAKGGVLFIDEAYAIFPPFVTTLIQEMEEKRDEVIVIFAGYEAQMKGFLKLNDGLKSRIPYMIKFPDYNPEELMQIFDFILEDKGYVVTPSARSIVSELMTKACTLKNYGNGRYVRNIVDQSIGNLSYRLYKQYGEDKDIPSGALCRLTDEDIYIPDGIVKTGSAQSDSIKKFKSLVGLQQPKKIIDEAVKTYKATKLYKDMGIDIGTPTMHMVFTGNPGTAKTTVAEYLAQVMKDEGLLSSGVFVRASRADLIAEHVGETAPKVRAVFESAMGGVLFIDEAYSLLDGYKGYGNEAIATIIEEMENRRDNIVVIFAGYPKEMTQFIDANPGMKSRISKYVNFEDYTVDELIDITKFMVKARGFKLSDSVIKKLYPIYEEASKNKAYGNGRYVRKVVDEMIKNTTIRVLSSSDEDLTKKFMTTILPEDVVAPTDVIVVNEQSRKFGFI